ncbi:MAG: hypothetical protein IKI37_04150, partial [Oscillospiraceae bacterium]|nr:hypothetical protein [Oscillospiraceae bacterium]
PADKIGIVIEVKYGENREMEKGCDEALQQIEDRNYVQFLLDKGMTTILKYGVACYNKESMDSEIYNLILFYKKLMFSTFFRKNSISLYVYRSYD